MKNIFSSVKTFALAHKVTTGIIAVLVVWGGYYEYKKLTSTSGETRYVLAQAQVQTIISSITGSGQVSADNQVDLKPKVSGDIVYLGVSSGQSVKAGALIAQLDATDAQKSVRDAQTSLETAQLSLQKLIQPPDELELTQAENSLARAVTSKQNTEDDLAKTYDDTFNSISNAFLDLPGIVSGLHDLLFTPNAQLGGTNVNNIDYYSSSAAVYDPRGTTYGADADAKYQIALAKYNKNFGDFKNLDRTADKAAIELMLAETYDTTLALSDAVKSANNLIQFFVDQMTQHSQRVPALSSTQLASLNTYTGTTNTHITDLLSKQNIIKSDKNALIDAARSIDESTKSLAKLKSGPDALDIRSSEITVAQRQNALTDAQTAMSNYAIRAPFDGTIAKLTGKKGDSASPSTVIATLITTKKIAEISLNEVDAAKIKVGQKATLTFDAVDGLVIAAEVAEVDTIGTVSQGVVTYSVTLSFDTQDERVKSGMSVSAAIVTNVKQNVLAVPASAVKMIGDSTYVEILDGVTTATSGGTQGVTSATAPRQQAVVVGFSNDTLTEITSGLKDGDMVVTRTISATTQTTTSAPSLFGGGGGATRAIRN